MPRRDPGLTVTVPTPDPFYVMQAKRVAHASLKEQCTITTARVVVKDTEVELARYDGKRWIDTPQRGGTA